MGGKKREIISLHIGQAGVQMGDSMWELLGLEHGINEEGKLIIDQTDATPNPGLETFYYRAGGGKYVPRAIMVDLEPSVVDEVRRGKSKKMWHPEQLISGKEDAANNFARGHYSVGRNHIDKVLDRIRKLADACDGLQGFVITHSVGGGTGSGFASLLLERLATEFPRTTKLDYCVYPSKNMSTSVVEPYNSVLSTHALMEYADVTMVLENEALYDVCANRIRIEKPDYRSLNSVIAQLVSSMTASLRFSGVLNTDLNEFRTNLVPYPRIHFVLPSFAPVVSREVAFSESNSVAELTNAVFDSSSFLSTADPRYGKYMACCLMYRGDVISKEVTNALQHMRNKASIQFVDWSPTGFKCGINNSPPTVLPDSQMAKTSRSLTLLANSTAVAQSFSSIDKKFDLMYAKRAFVHWMVGEGLEESELATAREDLAALEKDYEEIATDGANLSEIDDQII